MTKENVHLKSFKLENDYKDWDFISAKFSSFDRFSSSVHQIFLYTYFNIDYSLGTQKLSILEKYLW